MPCRLRREPLRAGAAFMRVNSLTSLLRKRCLLRTPSSPPQMKKTNLILSGSFSFRGLCAAMPCHLRCEPLRAGAAFMRVNSLTSLLRKRCLLRPPHLHQCRSPMNTGLQAHRTSFFVTQNHPLTQILFVPERLWILFCFWLSIMRKGQSLSFCGRRVRLP